MVLARDVSNIYEVRCHTIMRVWIVKWLDILACQIQRLIFCCGHGFAIPCQIQRVRYQLRSSANTPACKTRINLLGEALVHGGIANGVKVNIEWIDSELFEQEDAAVEALHHVSGISVPGGFGERGSEGKSVRCVSPESKIFLFWHLFGMQWRFWKRPVI